MTSLSAKLTDYKTKSNKQASIALSTTGESKKAIENSATNKQTESPPKPEASSSKAAEANAKKPLAATESFSSPFESSFDSKPKDDSSGGDGWNVDQWQEFDDDNDLMEPLEPFTNTPNFNNTSVTKPNLSTNTSNPTSTAKTSGDGWDKFDTDDYSEPVIDSSKSNKSNTTKTWNVQNKVNTINDEEALFSSLVKDVCKKILNQFIR